MNFFRGGDYQRRPGPYAHMHRAVCGQRARPAEAALARAGWTGVYRTRVILRGGEGVNPLPFPGNGDQPKTPLSPLSLNLDW
mgnify:CR=1 FL=1